MPRGATAVRQPDRPTSLPSLLQYLFQGAEPGPPYITGDHLVENAGGWVGGGGVLRGVRVCSAG